MTVVAVAHLADNPGGARVSDARGRGVGLAQPGPVGAPAPVGVGARVARHRGRDRAPLAVVLLILAGLLLSEAQRFAETVPVPKGLLFLGFTRTPVVLLLVLCVVVSVRLPDVPGVLTALVN